MAFHVISTERRENDGIKEYRNTIKCSEFDTEGQAIDFCICYPEHAYEWTIINDYEFDKMLEDHEIDVWIPDVVEDDDSSARSQGTRLRRLSILRRTAMGYAKAYTIIGMKINYSALTNFDGDPIYTEFEGDEAGKLGPYDIIEQVEGDRDDVFIAHSFRAVDENDAEPVKWVTSGPGSKLSMREIELEMRANLPHDIGFDGEFGLWTMIAYR